MSDIEAWMLGPPKWSEKHKILLPTKAIKPVRVSLQHVLDKSDNFHIKFPIESVRCKTLLSTLPKRTLESNVQSAYPLMHECALHLCAEFLLLKQNHGTAKEQELYRDMNLVDFMQRLLDKRAVMFVGKKDLYILRNNTLGIGAWKTIGQDDETPPLVLKDYLSYDEIKLSAFLSVSSYSYFINIGSRYNSGNVENDREIVQDTGVIVGLIGTRLVKPLAMDYEEIVISASQNTVLNGYGDSNTPNIHNLFSIFYEESAILHNNVRYGPLENVNRFRELKNGSFFDNLVYSKRLAVSFDTFLLEANFRAKKTSKFAYVHIVGIGLGCWRISSHQEDIFVDTFGKRISALGTKLNNISDIHFAYFERCLNCSGYADKEIIPIEGHPNGGIKIYISPREPFTKLNEDKLLVVSFAWDGNALPGNEFWNGCTSNSSDSATASSSQIAELHNPFINDTVCANNLMITTVQGDVIHISDYCHRILKDINTHN